MESMIALVPDRVDAARLHVPGGLDAGELHATVAYFADLDEAHRDRMAMVARQIAGGHEPFFADAFSVSAFNPNGEHPCIVLGLGGRELQDIHQEFLDMEGEAYPQRTPYIPHITLEYTDDVARGAGYVDRTGPVRFDRVRLAFGDEVMDFPMRNRVSMTAAVNQTSWQSMPLAPRETKFNADDAVSRILAWSNGSASKFNSAFLWRSDASAVSRNNYRLPIADVINGKLTLIPRAVFSAAVIMSGGHGGLEGLIKSEDERRQIKQVLTEIYDMLREEYDDPRVVAPWLLGRTEEEQDEIRKELDAA